MSTVKKVLLIDDEEPILELFSKALEVRGHQYDTAENGRIGFRKAIDEDWDLIICDLHMPEWNGVESIKGILMIKPDSKFMVVSGYADYLIADEVRDIDNVIAVLGKPVELADIIKYVENC
ncbi:MAG: response regulator [Desulfocapsa sp.]|nr:response regulator [Desulfocapsa sp.]